MSSTLNRLALVAGMVALAVTLRRQLVDVLTKTTGTWIGSPPAPPAGREP